MARSRPSLSTGRKYFSAGFLLTLLLVTSAGAAQQVRMDSKVEVSPASGGWYPWYEVAADPTDPNNLIVCGSKWDTRDNGFYGFVYSSSDGGKTWRIALEDKNSTWVSEQSCAFGINGKAYFVSEAAHVIDGAAHLDDVGTTRVFASNDGGGTWREAAKTGWADHTATVVETNSGPNQNRLYVFFNYMTFRTPDPVQEAERNGGHVGLITLKDDKEQLTSPIVSPNMMDTRYRGSFAMKAVILKDGGLLCLFYAGLKAQADSDTTMIGAVHTDSARLRLSDPVEITRIAAPSNGSKGCYSSDLAMAYDGPRGLVYVAYHSLKDGQCRLMLTTSADDGRTWSKGLDIPQPDTVGHGFYSPAMAINRDSVLGLMWRDGPVSDCWYFSISVDNGKTFGAAEPLSQCSERPAASLFESDAFLRTWGTIWVSSDPLKQGSFSGHRSLALQIIDERNVAWRNISSLVATSDGVFHPLWIELGSGKGQLRTAAVRVEAPDDKLLKPYSFAQTDGWDVTQKVSLLYGGNTHYETSGRNLKVDIVLKNRSNERIRAPLLLEAITLTGDVGKLEISNADNRMSGPGAVWDLSGTLSNGVLEPGATTAPYRLVFHVPNAEVPPEPEVKILSLQLKVTAFMSSPSTSR